MQQNEFIKKSVLNLLRLSPLDAILMRDAMSLVAFFNIAEWSKLQQILQGKIYHSHVKEKL